MKDIAGEELTIGDTVVVPLGVSELRIGTIVKFTPKKIKVESDVVSGLFVPEAILKIDSSIKEMTQSILYANGEQEVFELSVTEVYENTLSKLGIEESDISDGEFFEKEDECYVSFEHRGVNYEIEPKS